MYVNIQKHALYLGMVLGNKQHTCSWPKNDRWMRTTRELQSSTVWISRTRLYRQTCKMKKQVGQMIKWTSLHFIIPSSNMMTNTKTTEVLQFIFTFIFKFQIIQYYILLRVLITYFACLLRSVTFTFPRTRLRYNLHWKQDKILHEWSLTDTTYWTVIIILYHTFYSKWYISQKQGAARPGLHK